MFRVVSSSLKDPDISLERERLTQIQIISCLTVGVSGLQDIEKIEAKCEVSGVTEILLKAYHNSDLRCEHIQHTETSVN